MRGPRVLTRLRNEAVGIVNEPRSDCVVVTFFRIFIVPVIFPCTIRHSEQKHVDPNLSQPDRCLVDYISDSRRAPVDRPFQPVGLDESILKRLEVGNSVLLVGEAIDFSHHALPA